jgi:hypothetical protein
MGNDASQSLPGCAASPATSGAEPSAASRASLASIARYWAEAPELADISHSGEPTIGDLRFCLQRCADLLSAESPADAGEPLPWNEIPPAQAMGRWVLQAHPGLHERTAKLVRTFAFALANKLQAAERKYGYSDGWARNDWEAECQRHLMEHVAKGDPLDVAAYAAFCWHNKWSSAPDAADTSARPAEPREDGKQ